jgi:hypothetical protein
MPNYLDLVEGKCSYPCCTDEYDVRYLAGATLMNPQTDVQLCDGHLPVFIRDLDAERVRRRPVDPAKAVLLALESLA